MKQHSVLRGTHIHLPVYKSISFLSFFFRLHKDNPLKFKEINVNGILNSYPDHGYLSHHYYNKVGYFRTDKVLQNHDRLTLTRRESLPNIITLL